MDFREEAAQCERTGRAFAHRTDVRVPKVSPRPVSRVMKCARFVIPPLRCSGLPRVDFAQSPHDEF